MRYVTPLMPMILACTLTGTIVFAAETDRTNVFNANMTNADLAAVITTFEDVCLPFIVHTTDLPQSLDQQHHVKLLSKQRFKFQSRARLEDRYVTKRNNGAWKFPTQAIGAKTFTFFNIPDEKVDSTQTVIEQTGEINWRNWVRPNEYKIFTRDIDTYVSRDDLRQTVSLGWNYPSQNHPGKTCEVLLKTSDLPSAIFEADLIVKDADWKGAKTPGAARTQCTRDGKDEFKFTAQLKDEHISLLVRRNDLYEAELCTAYDLNTPAVSKTPSL